MSKALCRYVALLRAVDGVKLNPILKEELRLLFTESGAAWAETYIASGNVVFECQSFRIFFIERTIVCASSITLSSPSLYEQWSLCTKTEFLRSTGPITSETATFLSCPAKTVPELPVTSQRGDICLFEMRKDIVLSHRFQVNGNAGDANALTERLFDVPGTSRSWNTVEGLVRKLSASPTTKGSG